MNGHRDASVGARGASPNSISTTNSTRWLARVFRTRVARHQLLLVLAVALALRLAVFIAALAEPHRFWRPDSGGYLGLAGHLHPAYLGEERGHWFALGLERTPVYPLFIKAVYETFGSHYEAVIAVQLFLSTATVALTYWLATRLVSREVALVAAFLLAIDPASVVYGNLLLTETLFTFLLTLAVLLVVIGSQRVNPVIAFAGGCLVGLAALTRPVAEYMPLVLILVIGVAVPTAARARIALVAAIVVGSGLFVGGWIGRNVHATGVPILSTIEGKNMLYYRAVGALEESGETAPDAQNYVRAELARRIDPHENAAQLSRTEFSLGLRIVMHHPAGAAKSWAKGVGRILFGPAKGDLALLLTGQAATSPLWLHAFVILAGAITAAIVLAAAVGVVELFRGRTDWGLFVLLAIIAYLIVISAGPEAYARFRVGVEPFIVILGAIGACSLSRRFGRPRRV